MPVIGSTPHHFAALDSGRAQILERSREYLCVRTVTSDAKPVTEAVQTSVPHVTLLDRTHILALISGRAHGGLAIHAASAPRLSIVLQVSNVTQARA